MIQARVPAMSEAIDPRAEVLSVVNGMGSLNGIVCDRVGTLSFVDTATHTIHRYRMGRHQTKPNEGTLGAYRSDATGVYGLTIDHQGRLLASYRSECRVTRVDMDGVERDIGVRGVGAPADLVYAIDGSTYVADLPAPGTDGAVYQHTRGGATRVAASTCPRPGGITLDPRQLHLLVADQHLNAIYRFPITADGSLESPSVVIEGPTGDASTLGPLKADEEGRFYVTSSAGLLIYSPDGVHLGTVVLPEPPVNLCWGRGFLGLYLSTRTSIYFVPTKVRGTRTF
jgi:gluconolactonase